MRGESKSGRFSDSWSLVWGRRCFRLELACTLLCFLLVLIFLSSFLRAVELRSGVVLPDPLLLLFPRADLTWLTFGLIYLALAVGLVNLCRFPESLVIAMQSYTLMTLARMAMMYAMPLDAPPGMIPLHDPFVEVVGTGRLLTKDLFFSGHASTMVLLSLTAPQRRTKFLFGLCAVLVGVFVLIQRVHYSADVLAAPVFSYLAYRVVVLAHLKAKDSSRIH